MKVGVPSIESLSAKERFFKITSLTLSVFSKELKSFIEEPTLFAFYLKFQNLIYYYVSLMNQKIFHRF